MTGVAPPPREDLGLLAFAVACVSSAPPLIAATAAPALAIAFWRTGLGALALLPFVLGRRRAELRRASRRTIALAVFGGTMLGLARRRLGTTAYRRPSSPPRRWGRRRPPPPRPPLALLLAGTALVITAGEPRAVART